MTLLNPSTTRLLVANGLPLILIIETCVPRSANPEAVGPTPDWTAGASSTSESAFLPLTGNSCTRRFSITLPKVAVVVSTSDVWPETSITSLTAPVSNVTSIWARWSTSSVTPLRTAFLKPSLVTAIV